MCLLLSEPRSMMQCFLRRPPALRRLGRHASQQTAARGDYGRLGEQDVAAFERMLGARHVLRDDLDPYNVDFMRWYRGGARCVLTPDSAEQVSAVLRHCHDRRLALCPQGGNTGLVGGSVPVHDELVLSTRKLNKHFKLHKSAGIVEADAGFILQELDDRLAPDDYMMPIDLGAKGSCCIGGNIATNAGGIRLLRYGSLHANVLSLQVVLPDAQGSILDLGSPLRKDNSDLKLYQLFVGSEGQLGVITRCAVLVVPKPRSVQLAFLGAATFADCCAVLRRAKADLGEILSSFELMDAESARSVVENAGLPPVLDSAPAFNLIIETSGGRLKHILGSNPQHDSEKMETFLAECLDSGLANDGVMAQSQKDSDYFWKIRENASLALIQDGYVYKHDLSLPLDHFYELTEVVRQRLKGTKTKRVVTFGHVGDGNTHLNVTSEQFDQEIHDKLYPFIYEWTAQHNGSISAEHGIGRLKREYHHDLVNPKKQAINAQIKKAFDPRGILSPYKMID